MRFANFITLYGESEEYSVVNPCIFSEKVLVCLLITNYRAERKIERCLLKK